MKYFLFHGSNRMTFRFSQLMEKYSSLWHRSLGWCFYFQKRETIEELTVIYLISRNSKTFEWGFINYLTNQYTSCMLYFLKFKAVKVSFLKCLRFFGSYFHEVEIEKKHFHFQKWLKFRQLAKNFRNVFQTSEVKYVTD